MNNIDRSISALVSYAINCRLIDKMDERYYFNRLLGVIRLEEGQYFYQNELSPLSNILTDITKYAVKNEIIDDYLPSIDNFKTQLMDIFIGSLSNVYKTFQDLYSKKPSLATDYLYKLMIDANYIRLSEIAKNIKWDTLTKYGKMEMTINLSKPEKDPRLIALAKTEKNNKYPKCLLCKENIGYSGTISHPSRANLRYIPIILNNQNWYLQYSPYLYFEEHCIVLSEEHCPMKITDSTFTDMIQFIELFPYYFLGSNADLPIVGGSILSHNHYQGGRHHFPIFDAKSVYSISKHDCCIEYLDWPLDTIKITSAKSKNVIDVAKTIYSRWLGYSNSDIGLIAKDDEQHNTVTPIAAFNQNNEYTMYIILRNNRTTANYPYGLFHPREELHHIKKENIGLIEAMGLAILPGRLEKELFLAVEYLNGANVEVGIHKDWLETLEKNLTAEQLYDEVTNVFIEVLEDCSVFKYSKNKKEEAIAFLKSCNLVI